MIALVLVGLWFWLSIGCLVLRLLLEDRTVVQVVAVVYWRRGRCIPGYKCLYGELSKCRWLVVPIGRSFGYRLTYLFVGRQRFQERR